MKAGWTHKESPFHAGEQAIQQRLGVQERAEDLGRRVIRDYLPEQHREFYHALPFLVVATTDAQERPWVSLIAGPQGFIASPDPQHMQLNAAPLFGSPLAESGDNGTPIGILGILPETRRRNRSTGRILERSENHLTVAIDQTFGNCPQYIQARSVEPRPSLANPAAARPVSSGTSLDDQARALIRGADTFFIGTSHGDGSEGPHTGADASHRGGKPGFVHVDGNTLSFPDFSGNNHFNTLGNIELNGRAGLMFMDFDSGDLLYLTGRAEIVWDDPTIQDFAGAQRFVRIEVQEWRRVADSLPIRFHFGSYSPSLEALGSWEAVDVAQAASSAGANHDVVEVSAIVDESRDIRSIYLRPHGESAPRPHAPGQFLPIRLQVPGSEDMLQRVYSLSAASDGKHYRLSVKRDGAASSQLHDHLRVGDRLLAGKPAGQFVLDSKSTRPVVLLSAGVGITPMLAMAQTLVAQAAAGTHQREVFFVHGTRDASSHAFADELRALKVAYKNFHVHTAYSKAAPGDRLGLHFDSAGRVDLPLLKKLLPLDDYDFYLCGPGDFMQSLYDGLRGLQIPESRIRFEAFGPSTIKTRAPAADPSAITPAPAPPDTDDDSAQPITVYFEQSNVEAQWRPERGSLLELAESEGIAAPFSCRSGACGACATGIRKGEVRYGESPDFVPEDGEVLLCSATPAPLSSGSDRLVLML
ncbi:MAG: ferredoxin-NADP reductase [Halieaceae bacterium]|jgi:ferredoxin-NADP reductase/predicted pyridoxine 5'-phosphate oxidase superfamily flavin-nucleotide-binding protein